jgi:hypothetical protein
MQTLNIEYTDAGEDFSSHNAVNPCSASSAYGIAAWRSYGSFGREGSAASMLL